ncbi:MAG: phosphotransferase [Gemmatimonadetes bacterium]|nr:phosphotransferase [Gemmatimonadota bacterium]
MSPPPWHADRPLTLGTARAVVRAAFPEAAADSLEWVGSGWDFDAYRSSDDWLFRFPRRADVVSLFEREGPILELARSVLPRSVSVPLVRVMSHAVPEFPYPIAAHPLIPGVRADDISDALRSALAESLGEALGTIHSVPEAVARTAGLAELDRSEPGRIDWFTRGLAGVRALNDRDGTLNEAVEWLSQVDDPLRRLDAPLRMIHHDVSPEHLLVDPETGRLVGILDWTDAILGDPARDFAPLVPFAGWGFVDDVLRHYPLEIDEGFRHRLGFMARLLPLMWLGHAYVHDEEVAPLVAWVKNCFAEGSTS